MNRLCINLEVPKDTILGLHNHRMSKPLPGQNSTAYDIFYRIMMLMHESKITQWRPIHPLMPQGTVEEMLAGQTETIALKHRMFEFNFSPTTFGAEYKEELKQKLSSYNYFSWVD